jgi:hypothetical protein
MSFRIHGIARYPPVSASDNHLCSLRARAGGGAYLLSRHISIVRRTTSQRCQKRLVAGIDLYGKKHLDLEGAQHFTSPAFLGGTGDQIEVIQLQHANVDRMAIGERFE